MAVIFAILTIKCASLAAYILYNLGTGALGELVPLATSYLHKKIICLLPLFPYNIGRLLAFCSCELEKCEAPLKEL